MGQFSKIKNGRFIFLRNFIAQKKYEKKWVSRGEKMVKNGLFLGYFWRIGDILYN